jgi:cation diffusion facilitator family transporter
MSDHSSSAKAILYAFTANLGIALAKLAASIYTHSGSMMAEAIHSFADCGNQVLLYLGLRQAQKPPDAKHPLGYGKVTYFWSFIVALLLFSMGGLFSMYEGWHKLHAPEELHQAWIALAVLGVSILLEFGSLMGCLREIKKLRKDKPLWRWVSTTRNAELVVVLGEDLAALLGLALAFMVVALATVTGNPVFDAAGSIVIGVILVCVSIFIAHRIKGLLVGKSAEDDLVEELRAEVAGDPDIQTLLNAITLQMGPDVMLALKVQMRPGFPRRGGGVDKRAGKTHQDEISNCRVVLRRARLPTKNGASPHFRNGPTASTTPRAPAASHSISAAVLSRPNTALRWGKRPNLAMMSRCWRAKPAEYLQYSRNSSGASPTRRSSAVIAVSCASSDSACSSGR